MNKRYGFTLVEIMFVVAIIGLLASIAIPSFVKARQNSQAKACINNLRILDAAKEQSAMENKWPAAQAVALGSAQASQALAYVKGNIMPTCPAAGTYALSAFGTSPTCTTTDHILP